MKTSRPIERGWAELDPQWPETLRHQRRHGRHDDGHGPHARARATARPKRKSPPSSSRRICRALKWCATIAASVAFAAPGRRSCASPTWSFLAIAFSARSAAGCEVALSVLDYGRCTLSAGCVGGAKRCLEMAVERARNTRAVRPAHRQVSAHPEEDRPHGRADLRHGCRDLPVGRTRRPARP